MKLRNAFIALCLLIFCLDANAGLMEMRIDGIIYNLDTSTKTASVTHNKNGYSGHVSIPDSLKFGRDWYKVTSIEDSAFYNCSKLKTVSIPKNVKTIGKRAFYKCTQFLGANFFSTGCLTTIGIGAFDGCQNMLEAQIPSNVTSIGERAFADCSALSRVTLGSSVATIGKAAFYGCKISSLVIPKSVVLIEDNAFGNCEKLEECTLACIIHRAT